MRKVIVTGANGFIGSNLCNKLTSEGIEVAAIVRSRDSDISRLKMNNDLHIFYLEMSDYAKLPEILKDFGADTIYHLAWEGSSGILRSNENTQLRNIRNSCIALRMCKSMGCKRFIFASSIMEYEIYSLMNTAESPGINTIYSTAKLSADYMMRAIAADEEIEYMRGIISNIYGPGEKSERLINASIRELLRGEHCSFSSGNQLYDFIYITDAVDAFIAIGESGKGNSSYYIGSGKPRKLQDYLIEMRDVVDPGAEIGLGEIAFNGVSLTYHEFDMDLLKRDTGFSPGVAFRDGIRKTADWIKCNG